MDNQKPSLGRIVHYTDSNHISCAAMITAVNADGDVSLTVFPPGMSSYPVMHSTQGEGVSTWHWPERV